jgi:hypothetical protein
MGRPRPGATWPRPSARARLLDHPFSGSLAYPRRVGRIWIYMSVEPRSEIQFDPRRIVVAIVVAVSLPPIDGGALERRRRPN